MNRELLRNAPGLQILVLSQKFGPSVTKSDAPVMTSIGCSITGFDVD